MFLRYPFVPALVAIVATLSNVRADDRLRIELVSDVASVQAGVPFHVGLNLKHKEGYHTYWKFPGIVGVPTGIEWNLPPGFKAGPIEWPEPQKVMMFEIKAQGFEGEVLLPMLITPPKDLPPGSRFTLQGKAGWMCCGRDCNPGFNDVSLTLQVAEKVQPDELWQPKFKAALASVAHPLEGWKCSAKRKDGKVTLHMIADSAEAKAHAPKIKDVLFFTEDGLINFDKPQTLKKDDGAITLELEVSQYADNPKAKKLVGIVQSPQGWSDAKAAKSATISVPVSDE